MKHQFFPVIKWSSRLSLACMVMAAALAVFLVVYTGSWTGRNLTIIDTGPIMADGK